MVDGRYIELANGLKTNKQNLGVPSCKSLWTGCMKPIPLILIGNILGGPYGNKHILWG